jgi:hypothetical protein
MSGAHAKILRLSARQRRIISVLASRHAALRKARPLAVGRRLYLSAGDGMAVLGVKHFL